MGRIKTKLIKRTTEELMEKHGNEVADNFDDNKKVTQAKLKISSKKMRNVVAGYLTRLKKKGR